MLDILSDYGYRWDIKFNAKKTQAMVIGKDHCKIPALLELSGEPVIYVKQYKYLGFLVKADKRFICDTTSVIKKFYRALNGLLRFRTQPSADVKMHLLMAHFCSIP